MTWRVSCKIYPIFYRVLKFIYSEKATTFGRIFTLLLTVRTLVKNKVKISQNFVAFSEYMNFTKIGADSWLGHKYPKCLKKYKPKMSFQDQKFSGCPYSVIWRHYHHRVIYLCIPAQSLTSLKAWKSFRGGRSFWEKGLPPLSLAHSSSLMLQKLM